MDRILNRRALLLGTGAVAASLAIEPVAANESLGVSADSAEITSPEFLSTPERNSKDHRLIKGFLVGTGRDPLGVSIEIFASDGLASIDVSPMTQKSFAGCIESNDPAVCAFLQEVVARIRAESEVTRIRTAFDPSRRKPGIRGEWIECPVCLGRTDNDCDLCGSCGGRGAIWRRF